MEAEAAAKEAESPIETPAASSDDVPGAPPAAADETVAVDGDSTSTSGVTVGAGEPAAAGGIGDNVNL